MAQKKAKEKKTVKPVEPDRVYHISYRKLLRKWQVKAEGDSKALKLFWTQAEAIDYAKSSRAIGRGASSFIKRTVRSESLLIKFKARGVAAGLFDVSTKRL